MSAILVVCIRVGTRFMDIERPPSQRVRLAILPCVVKGSSGTKVVGIYLEALSENKQYFKRVKVYRMEFINIDDHNRSKYIEESVCVRRWRQTLMSQSMLVKAAENGHEAAVKLLLEKGATPDLQAQCAAVNNGSEAVLKLLFESGASSDYAEPEVAARNRKYAITKRSLENDVCVPSRTIIHPRGGKGKEEARSSMKSRSSVEKTAGRIVAAPSRELMAAATKGDEARVRLLTRDGFWPDGTIAEAAAEEGHDVIVMLLLERAAN